MKVLVLGSTGLLGIPLSAKLEQEGYTVIRHGYKSLSDYQVDMTILSNAKMMLNEVNPDVVINLIALTSIDACEKDPNSAYLLNVRTVENLISWAKNHNRVKIIHISTDHMYDGHGPHPENDVTIRNYYAFSKYCAEHVALRATTCILRTNFVGRSQTPGRKSFSDWIIESLRDKKHIKLFKDVKFSPLSIYTLSNLIALVIEKFTVGVFNLGSSVGISKRDFGILLAERLALSTSPVEDALSTDIKFSAYLPKDMRMDCSLFEATFNIKLPTVYEEIELIGREYISIV